HIYFLSLHDALPVSLLFIVIFLYYQFEHDILEPSLSIFIVPCLIILTGAFALGSGLLISVFTAKYRDVDTLSQYLLRLFMFATRSEEHTSELQSREK